MGARNTFVVQNPIDVRACIRSNSVTSAAPSLSVQLQCITKRSKHPIGSALSDLSIEKASDVSCLLPSSHREGALIHGDRACQC
jgi:hypothetical protein